MTSRIYKICDFCHITSLDPIDLIWDVRGGQSAGGGGIFQSVDLAPAVRRMGSRRDRLADMTDCPGMGCFKTYCGKQKCQNAHNTSHLINPRKI